MIFVFSEVAVRDVCDGCIGAACSRQSPREISGYTAQAEPTAAAIAKRFGALARHLLIGHVRMRGRYQGERGNHALGQIKIDDNLADAAKV